MSTLRKAITIFDDTYEPNAITLLKPFSDEYLNYLIVVHEDALGEFSGMLKPIDEIRKNFGGSDEEFQEILKQLEVQM
jgi:hypothetical protein